MTHSSEAGNDATEAGDSLAKVTTAHTAASNARDGSLSSSNAATQDRNAAVTFASHAEGQRNGANAIAKGAK